MPLGKGVRYRVKTTGGKKIRLAFKGNKVIETKDLSTPGAEAHMVKQPRKKRTQGGEWGKMAADYKKQRGY